MGKILIIAPLFLVIALAVVPLNIAAQTPVLTEAAKLAQIAVQLEQIEQEVNRLTLLVTKIALEKQAADLEMQLAVLMPQEESVAVAPVAIQKPPAASQGLSPSKTMASQENMFAQPEKNDKKASGFAAALGPLGNLGTPELAALIILAILAVFILVRRLRERKQSSLPQTSQSPQFSSQPKQDLLDEGRQELSEKVAWK